MGDVEMISDGNNGLVKKRTLHNPNLSANNQMGYTQDVLNRFWKKVDIKLHENGNYDWDACWEWTAGKSDAGYGGFSLYGKPIRAHRFMYTCYNGPIGTGLYVCHSCDNPSCVNPSHLWEGTSQQNDQDKVAKGRSLPGELNPASKILDEEIPYILELTLSYTDEEIGDMYDVRANTINCIRLGKTHSSLTNIVYAGPKYKVFTIEQVKAIKTRLRDTDDSCPKIAKDYGVTRKTINNIQTEKYWAHIQI